MFYGRSFKAKYLVFEFDHQLMNMFEFVQCLKIQLFDEIILENPYLNSCASRCQKNLWNSTNCDPKGVT